MAMICMFYALTQKRPTKGRERFTVQQSFQDEVEVSSTDNIAVWGIDPGEGDTATFCRILRTNDTPANTKHAVMDDDADEKREYSHQSETSRILPPGFKAMNVA
ncbi:hypothetical protein FBU30_003422 [Linnemannia zychae]|nr:hypothetical protein FBU30_003422 [Linnemannia zychae]